MIEIDRFCRIVAEEAERTGRQFADGNTVKRLFGEGFKETFDAADGLELMTTHKMPAGSIALSEKGWRRAGRTR